MRYSSSCLVSFLGSGKRVPNFSSVLALSLLSSSFSCCAAASSTFVLERARALKPPIPNSTLDGEYEDSEFWNSNRDLIQKSWSEWETLEAAANLPKLMTNPHPRSLLDTRIRDAVEAAWSAAAANKNNTEGYSLSSSLQEQENGIRDLWQSVAPGVYACQLLAPNQIWQVRRHLQAIQDSRIPTRRPNGMNRYGYILDSNIPGAVSLTTLNQFCQFLVDDYLRPVGRLLFADYVGAPPEQQDDVESYAFTIRYKSGEDLYLEEHSDASLYTLNINLNLPSSPGEEDKKEIYRGSDIYFVEDATTHHHQQQKHHVSFVPGMAVLHRGMMRHAAQPIETGERTNLVLWVYGRDGYVRIAPYHESDQMTAAQRWKRVDGLSKEKTDTDGTNCQHKNKDKDDPGL